MSPPTPTPEVAVCIPTLGRPEAVRALLENLGGQELAPRAIVVVDASSDRATAEVCFGMSGSFAPGVLRHVPAERGLTSQRRKGIEILRRQGGYEFVCMLDDDVLLEPDFLALTTEFLSSEEGRAYGGVSGYDVLNWGVPFHPLERLYHRLRFFDGELRPGRWLQCGYFLQLSRLSRRAGIYPTDFLHGGLTVWRSEVFDYFLPPQVMDGYSLMEDKHLSLRVGSSYKLGVLGDAKLRHERAEGGRPRRVGMAYTQVRREALLLRDCDPNPTALRYLAFLAFRAFDLALQMLLSAVRLRWREVPRLTGRAAGWLSCLVPPKASADALVHQKRKAEASAGRKRKASASGSG